MKNLKLKLGFLICALIIVGIFVLKNASAELTSVDTSENEYGDLAVEINGPAGENKTEIHVDISNMPKGKRIVDMLYCKVSTGCSSWESLTDFDEENAIDGYENYVGNVDMALWFRVPDENIKIKAQYADLEPMDISYAKYNLSTEDENNLSEIYNDKARFLENYDTDNYVSIVEGYMGGDIVLPSGCTDNGCVLKVTLNSDDFAAYQSRLAQHNGKEHAEQKDLLSVGSAFNHLKTVLTDGAMILEDENGNVVFDVDNENNKTSFYIFINKFFTETNVSDFVVGEGKNRILHEDYIGIDYKLDNNRKYFDEKKNFGELTFTEFNNYKVSAEMFYGVKAVNFIVESQNPVVLASGGNADGMGTLHKTYTKIVSKDNTKYPIDSNFRLTINSFYEQDYNVELLLKDDNNETVQEVTFELARYAFGGNAGSLLVVDGDGINCHDVQANSHCEGNNMYATIDYRGLVDTFYTTGEGAITNKLALAIAKFDNEPNAMFNFEYTLYPRNKDFSPWATAVYYSGDKVIGTRSFDLSEIVTAEGYSYQEITPEYLIENNFMNHDEHRPVETTDFDGKNYDLYGYGNGYELPIKDIEYFDEESYNNGIIEKPIKIITREELNNNDITKIALFLTNGELKSDEANFPELTYGVGEGKTFYVDDRMFEEAEANN